MKTQSGFALPDLLFTLVAGLALLVMAYVLVSCGDRNQTGGASNAQQNAPQQDRNDTAQQEPADDRPAKLWPDVRVRQRDAAQLKGIHQAMVIHARDDDGWMPIPGRIRRQPVLLPGSDEPRFVPGRGDIDPLLNTTANLYSTMIMQNYVTPEVVISPWERNPRVTVIQSFNWDQYDPTQGVYWDNAFKADLERQSHASYAHLLLHGSRLDRQWRDTMDSQFAVLSNRGPKDGKGDPKSFTCDDAGNWQGNVVFNDNAVMWLDTMTPPGVAFAANGEARQDNLFAIDDGIHGSDIILTFTRSIDEDGPTIQHD